ncbi:MAG: VCBS repeat-containing protein [Deltaproteobacteria bacterium]|nr:VCBS repeat-containing protein [Deltaproteobacteria bacterium]
MKDGWEDPPTLYKPWTPTRKQRVLSIAKAQDADVMFFQEVNGAMYNDLKAAFGSIYQSHLKLTTVGTPFGNAIFSKLPLTYRGGFVVNDKTHNCASAKIGGVNVYSCHLPHPGYTDTYRVDSARSLAKQIRSPFVLGADLNTQGNLGIYQIVSAGYNGCGSGVDHVVTNMSCALEKKITNVASNYASDHPALVVRVPGGTVRWCYSPRGGLHAWRYALSTAISLNAIGLGDFNGDGKTDVFRTSGGIWYVSWSATGAWKQVNGSSAPLTDLRFGDFNGDGKTDVFRKIGNTWNVSWSATSSWKQVNISTDLLSDLRFGDFNGDGKTDVFLKAGNTWKVSWSATSSWKQVNISTDPLSDLRFGDFNGNGKTDVFLKKGNTWNVSWGATSSWKQINTSGVSLSDLRFGDFNGDGKTDVMYSGSDAWYISYGGVTSWSKRALQSIPVTEFLVGDFDGDGYDDLLYDGC